MSQTVADTPIVHPRSRTHGGTLEVRYATPLALLPAPLATNEAQPQERGGFFGNLQRVIGADVYRNSTVAYQSDGRDPSLSFSSVRFRYGSVPSPRIAPGKYLAKHPTGFSGLGRVQLGAYHAGWRVP